MAVKARCIAEGDYEAKSVAVRVSQGSASVGTMEVRAMVVLGENATWGGRCFHGLLR